MRLNVPLVRLQTSTDNPIAPRPSMKLASMLVVRLAPLFICATAGLAQSDLRADRLIAGLLYETKVTTASSMMSGPGMSSRMRTIEASGKLRNEVLEVSGGMPGERVNPMQGGPGSYTITLENGHLIGVDPVKREYFDVSLRDLFAGGSEMMNALQGMNLKISEEKYEAQDLGDGGVMLGHPTRHWRLSQTMTMSTQMMGDTMAVTSEMTTDTYYARDLEHMRSSQLDTAFVSTMMTVLPMADLKKAAAARARLPKTVPLKTIQKGLFLVGPMEVTMTTTTEVTKIEKGQFSESLFRAPEGYKLVEMPFPKKPGMTAPER